MTLYRIAVLFLVHQITGWPLTLSPKTRKRRMASFFGVSHKVVRGVWNRLDSKGRIPRGFGPKHLLWTLMFLKQYGTQTVLAAQCGVRSEKTWEHWVWIGVHLLENLGLIKWRNRYMDDNGSICLVTVDGTDCPIPEPSPFSRKWYSHKFHGPGVRYEVGVCIQTGWIVWVNGPFPCGEWPDLKICNEWLVHELGPGEKYLADRGYAGGWRSETPNGLNNYDQRMKEAARARHESVNGLLKTFKILDTPFRSPDLAKHYSVFMAVANICQAVIMLEGNTFDVDYFDNY